MPFAYEWGGISENAGYRYFCAHCDTTTTPTRTWNAAVHHANEYGQARGNPVSYAQVLICANCKRATFESPEEDILLPAPKQGAKLRNLPDGVAELYEEARTCSSMGAYTSAVMSARKLLMNLAVLEKAKEGLGYVDYVNYLDSNGFVPPKGKPWVDRIRKKGNEANHEIKVMTDEDCAEIMKLVEMLLRFNFDLVDPTAPVVA